MDQVTLGAVIMAVVEALKNALPTAKLNGWVTTVVAALLGGVAGYLHLLNTPDLATGIVIGLGAVGVHTVASAAGGK